MSKRMSVLEATYGACETCGSPFYQLNPTFCQECGTTTGPSEEKESLPLVEESGDEEEELVEEQDQDESLDPDLEEDSDIEEDVLVDADSESEEEEEENEVKEEVTEEVTEQKEEVKEEPEESQLEVEDAEDETVDTPQKRATLVPQMQKSSSESDLSTVQTSVPKSDTFALVDDKVAPTEIKKRHKRRSTMSTWTDVKSDNLFHQGYLLRRKLVGWETRYCRLETKTYKKTGEKKIKFRFFTSHGGTSKGTLTASMDKGIFTKLDHVNFDLSLKMNLLGIKTSISKSASMIILDAYSPEVREEWLQALRASGMTELPPSRLELLKSGYVNQRFGVQKRGIAAADMWNMRFARLEKLCVPDIEGKNEMITIKLKLFNTHRMEFGRSTISLDPKTASCMIVDRGCYDMGRRKFLVGIRKTPTSKKIVLDVDTPKERNEWITALLAAGLKDDGVAVPKKRDPNSIKEGWISKTGGKLKLSWNVRYAVLVRGSIFYFAHLLDKSPKNVFTLTAHTIIKDLDSTGTTRANIQSALGMNTHPHSFQVVTHDRVLTISCYDALNKAQWMACIEQGKIGV